jgi:hypothetical protein
MARPVVALRDSDGKASAAVDPFTRGAIAAL